MKIRVVSQIWFKEHGWGDTPAPLYLHPGSEFWRENYFISIRHSAEPDANCAIPVDGPNILKLQFDDVVEDPAHRQILFDGQTFSSDDLIEGLGFSLVLFDERLADEIVKFIQGIDRDGVLFVNCGAGISRSGAVGEVLNDYFNKYLERNELDDEYFRRMNRQIQGNPLVRRILREVLFGDDCM